MIRKTVILLMAAVLLSACNWGGNRRARTDEATPPQALLQKGPDTAYAEPDTVFISSEIPQDVADRMIGKSRPASRAVTPLEDLRYLRISYVDFSDSVRTGEMVCHKAIAGDLLDIFRELFRIRYQIACIRLVDDFGGDDEASMQANNTSCYNDRKVRGTANISKHALGMAVDVNPLQNPQVRTYRISPATAAGFADRTKDFPHKISHEDPCYAIFKAHGFTWGGDWPSGKDYQHFVRYH